MESLHERITRLRLAAGFSSKERLASAIGVSYQTVQQWERGKTAPARKHQQKLADALHRDISYVMYGTTSRKPEEIPAKDTHDVQQSATENTRRSTDRVCRVPLISWVQAGMWKVLSDELLAHSDQIETTYKSSGKAFALRVRGDMMEPRFPDGAILIVDPEDPATPGKFVIVHQNGKPEATFKQLVQDGGQFFLKPLNPQYPIVALSDDAVICGVVKRVEIEV